MIEPLEWYRQFLKVEVDYTLRVLSRFDQAQLDHRHCEDSWSIREHAAHLCMVKESILIAVLDERERYEELGRRCPGIGGLNSCSPNEVLAAYRDSCDRVEGDLERVRPERLDDRFRTMLGNWSTPRNYLFLLLQEEIHHRAQMMLIGRLLGVCPPEFPGRECATTGVIQEPETGSQGDSS